MTQTIRKHLGPTFFVAFVALALAWTGTAGAATLDVCASGCTYSTVAGALAAASAGDVIELANETFNEGGMTIDKNLTIRSASGMAKIDGTSYGWVFKIDSSAIVDLEDLRLEGGTYARIHNAGTLDLSTVYVLGSAGNPSTMGGLFNDDGASMTLADYSVVAGNSSWNQGGGITNWGDLVIIASTVTGNSGGNGGGLLNRLGTVAVLTSSFSANSADNKGGAWANVEHNGSTGTVSYFSNSSYSANSADVDCDTYWDESGPTCVN